MTSPKQRLTFQSQSASIAAHTEFTELEIIWNSYYVKMICKFIYVYICTSVHVLYILYKSLSHIKLFSKKKSDSIFFILYNSLKSKKGLKFRFEIK